MEIAGPGFLNIRLDAAAAGQLARVIVEAGAEYGRSDRLAGQRINLEFVSANPTGPVHIGGVRWAAVGDALSRLLRATGADVGTEYYFNDAGSQIDRFARSLLAAAQGRARARGRLRRRVHRRDRRPRWPGRRPGRAGRWTTPPPRRCSGSRASQLMFAEIQSSLRDFGVEFDTYFNEKDLHDRGELDQALDRLREQGHLYESEGATWLRTTDFGDDKDRVLRKSNGEWTYFAADCAYYLDKRERGFERVVIMLGADHHGYIGRMKAMAACFGDDPERNLEILIGQLVNLVRDGAPVRMSKRAGTVVTLEDLVDAIGVDAARYALARYSSDSPIDIDVGAVDPGQPRQPGLLRAVRGRPDRERGPQRRRGRADPGRRRRRSTPSCSPTRRRTSCSRRSPSSPPWSPPRPSCASRTGWPATWRSWPGRTTGSTTTAGSCRAATRRSPTCTGPGSG